jgi:hypothetical protein
MLPVAVRKALLVPALGAVIGLGLPSAAQAATAASAAVHAHQTVPHAVPNGEIEWFTGDTYPDTAAGLAACTAEGESYQREGVGSWSCFLGNPDAGLYGLWILSHIQA